MCVEESRFTNLSRFSRLHTCALGLLFRLEHLEEVLHRRAVEIVACEILTGAE